MFVTTLQLDNFDWSNIMHVLKVVYGRVSFTSRRIHNLLAPPFPYVGIQFTALFHTPPLLTSFVYSIAAPTIDCVF